MGYAQQKFTSTRLVEMKPGLEVGTAIALTKKLTDPLRKELHCLQMESLHQHGLNVSIRRNRIKYIKNASCIKFERSVSKRSLTFPFSYFYIVLI
jgi:hypothetical protein